MEIDLSKLSETQKRFYVQLLANSNLQFHKENNQFVAQFKVDTNRITPPDPPVKQPKPKRTDPLQSNNKKPLSRVVKASQFTKIQSLHPYVQIYIYPKRMPQPQLQQLIEGIYQRLWQQNKRKTAQLKSLNFPEWVYRNVLGVHKQKIKIQQGVVNLIDSLNHYSSKIDAVRVFSNFFSEKWEIGSLFYFLVLRGLLEEVTNDRIVQRGQSTQGWSSVLGYRMRSNPSQRTVTEEEVIQFLGVLCSGGLSCSKSKSKTFDSLFENLTQRMHYDGKKNLIGFYALLQKLIEEYIDTETSSCDMSLSKTELANQDQSLSELITDDYSHDQPLKKQSQPTNIPPVCNYTVEITTPTQLIEYNQRVKQQKQENIEQEFRKLLMEKTESMYLKLGAEMSQKTNQSLSAALTTIIQLDKSHWIRYRGQITEAELLSIQKLQRKFRERTGCPQMLGEIVKGILLLPAVRDAMLHDIKL